MREWQTVFKKYSLIAESHLSGVYVNFFHNVVNNKALLKTCGFCLHHLIRRSQKHVRLLGDGISVA